MKKDNRKIPKRAPRVDFSKMKRVDKPDFSKMKIVCAPQDKVSDLEYWVNRILEVVGHPEALVTDESSLWDFFPFNEEADENKVRAIQNKLGVNVSLSDYLVDIAQRMRDSRRGKSSPEPTAEKKPSKNNRRSK